MKRLAIILIALFALGACAPSQKSPEYVVESYFTAMQYGDYEEAREYTDSWGGSEWEEHIRYFKKGIYKIDDFKIKDCKLNQNRERAIVNVILTGDFYGETTHEAKIILEFDDEEWLIELD